jgi:hypothetical protein
VITVAPSTAFEAVAQFDTGLTGTLGVRLIDNAGATTIARATAGIAEYPAGSGIYEVTLTAPGTAGQYSIVWDDGTNYAPEDLLVTATVSAALSSSNVYVTSAEVKSSLDASGTTYMDDDVDDAINAASRAIDEACGQRFFPSTETRVYTVPCHPSRWYVQQVYGHGDLEIDPLNALTSLKVDKDGDGTYEETWVEGTDFYLDPPNNPLKGYPYTRVALIRNAGRFFPTVDNGVQIAGSFGWAETPVEVKQYCKIFAAQLLLRSREAPFGVLMAGSEVGTSARIARFDPDFARMLGHLVKPYQLIA